MNSIFKYKYKKYKKKYLLLKQNGGNINEFDLILEKKIYEKKTNDEIFSIDFSKNLKKIIYSIENLIYFINIDSNIFKLLKGHTKYVESVGFNHDGTKIVSGSWDETIRVWNVDTGECILTLKGHTGWVNSVGFNNGKDDPNPGTKIVSGSWDKTIRVWNVYTGKSIVTLKGHIDAVYSVAFNHDGTKIVSGSEDTTIRVWDVNAGKLEQTLEGHTESVTSVGFNHDGTMIVSGSDDRTIRVWNVATGECISTLEGHTKFVKSVGFNHDGTKIVSGSYDDTIRVWNVDTDKSIINKSIIKFKPNNIHPNKKLKFNNDGTKIICGGNYGEVFLYKLVKKSDLEIFISKYCCEYFVCLKLSFTYSNIENLIKDFTYGLLLSKNQCY